MARRTPKVPAWGVVVVLLLLWGFVALGWYQEIVEWLFKPIARRLLGRAD